MDGQPPTLSSGVTYLDDGDTPAVDVPVSVRRW